MKLELEKELGIKLIDKENYTENKTIFGGFLYFFKKELKQDHYFTTENKVYVLKHNKDNYDISLTETGKLENSFKIPFSKCELVQFHKSEIIPRQTEEELHTLKLKMYVGQLKELITKIEEELNVK